MQANWGDLLNSRGIREVSPIHQVAVLVQGSRDTKKINTIQLAGKEMVRKETNKRLLATSLKADSHYNKSVVHHKNLTKTLV